ncbi:MAG: right-handed parallel beta-helix repeat-containing protein [Phycisphaerales bacterium]
MVGTADDDLRLLPLSPGIDAGGDPGIDRADTDGDGVLSEPVAQDIDGVARVYGAASDIGASEGPVLTVVTADTPLTIAEGGSVSFVVKLTRDPGQTVRVTASAAAAGGAAPAMSPAFVDLDSGNWQSGVSVTVSWPNDNGFTDDRTDLVFAGTGIAANRQPVVQIDGTTPGGVVYVNPQGTLTPDGASWASGYRTIQEALAVAAAFPGIQQVWVKAGTYHPPATPNEYNQTRRLYTIRAGLRFVGGFAGTETSPSQRDLSVNRTIITGDNQGNDAPGFTNFGDNCETLCTVTDATEGTEIDGIEFERSTVAAVLADAHGFVGDSLTVRNCRFAFNQGKALKRRSAHGHSGIYNCVFEDNGVSNTESKAVDVALATDTAGHAFEVAGSTFRRNFGTEGAGLSFEGAFLSMSGCVFEQNTGYGRTAYIQIQGPASIAPLVTVSDSAVPGEHRRRP